MSHHARGEGRANTYTDMGLILIMGLKLKVGHIIIIVGQLDGLTQS